MDPNLVVENGSQQRFENLHLDLSRGGFALKAVTYGINGAFDEWQRLLAFMVWVCRNRKVGVADKFANANQKVQKMIIYGALLAAALGPLMIAAGLVVKAFVAFKVVAGAVATAIGALSWPILLIIAAVAALALAWRL